MRWWAWTQQNCSMSTAGWCLQKVRLILSFASSGKDLYIWMRATIRLKISRRCSSSHAPTPWFCVSWALFSTISPYGWRSRQLYHPGAHSYRRIPKRWCKTSSPSGSVLYESVIYQQMLFHIYILTSNIIIKAMRSLIKEQRDLIYLWLRV